MVDVFETNRNFWIAKIKRNMVRDRLVNLTLRENGWTMVRVWQYQPRIGTWKRKVTAALYPRET